MNNQWKKLAAAFGAAAITVCQGGVLQVNAEEVKTQETILEEVNAQETRSETAAAVENQVEEVSLEAPQWLDSFGYATFKIPYEKGTVTYKFSLYKNGEFISLLDTWNNYNDKEKGETAWISDPHRVICESGIYEIKAEIFNMAGEQIGSVTSNILDYKAPNESIPIPSNIVWNEDGTFSCDLDIENRYIDSYYFWIYDQTGECDVVLGLPLFAVDSFKNKGVTITNIQKGIALNLNELITYYGYDVPLTGYSVRVEIWSNDKFVYKNSSLSEPVYLGGVRPQPPVTDSHVTDNQTTNRQTPNTDRQSNAPNNTSEEPALVKVNDWQPVTSDEKKRYAVYGKETISFTADAKGAYDVNIQNAMQGPLCFNSFESVLGDRVIARTYNILPSGGYTYKMEQKARISLQIPATIQAEDRAFQMICVTENGVPVILNDLDSDPATITFETDTYYAFALVYKDK